METNESQKDALISSFCNITGVEPSRGQFYLESSNWDLNLAIQSFFEHSDEPPISPNPIGVQPMPRNIETQPIVNQNESDSEMSDSSPMSSPKIHKKVVKKEPRHVSTSNIATLDSLKKKDDSGADSSDEEEGQAFYAGGSERSGQQVLGPKKKNADELVSNMFKSAKEHGAEVVDQSQDQKKHKNVNTFVGTGFRLGSTSGESKPVNTTTASSTSKKQNKEMVLKLWKNGFSVDEGQVRAYDDPQNREFLASIHRGEIPQELVKQADGQEVHLNMEDHRNEDFTAQKKRLQAFSGEGFRLGTPVADLVSSLTPLSTNNDPKKCEEEAEKRLNADPIKPITRIQIRLSDGTILVLKINLCQKISDIREYICNARPAYSSIPFVLMTTFPNKELTDETLTIKDANLANASIVQRLK